jgi:hypothetical protein
MSTVQQVGNALGVALIGILYYGAGSAQAGHALGVSLVYLFVLALGVAVLYRRFSRA